LAISERSSADYTVLISGHLWRIDDKPYIYILPKIIRRQIGFDETIKEAKAQSLHAGNGSYSVMFLEDVAYQKATIQTLQKDMIPARGINPGGQDKRARLYSVSHLIQNGTVLFPRNGANILINELLGLGSESHDDTVDALVYLLKGMMNMGWSKPVVTRIV